MLSFYSHFPLCQSNPPKQASGFAACAGMPDTVYLDYTGYTNVPHKKEALHEKRLLYLPLLFCLLFFTACGQAGNENIPAIETFPLTPSREGTEAVTALIEKLPAGYEEDTCFNVTPESISEKYGFTIINMMPPVRLFSCMRKQYILWENGSADTAPLPLPSPI